MDEAGYETSGVVVDRCGLAQEGEQFAVDLLGMGDAHDMRSSVDLDVMRVRKRRVQPTALAVDRQDPVSGPVQDERRDIDPLDVLAEVVKPAGRAGPCRDRRRRRPAFQRLRTVSSLTRLPR